MTEQTAKDILQELIRRTDAGDDTAIDDLIAEDMVNHAAAPQGRAGWKYIIEVIEHDLADVTIEHHALIGGRPGRPPDDHARDPPSFEDAAVVRRSSNRRSSLLALHPHLAYRQRSNCRALGLPRRHRTADGTRRLDAPYLIAAHEAR